jgi:alkylation response protein AidB-like acyl-CoA dehydrogenase
LTRDDPSAALLEALAALAPKLTERAADLDRDGRFPTQDIADLGAIGGLAAPLPRDLGGLGLGTEPGQGTRLLNFLEALGTANLSVGRIVEAHVNALRLVMRCGNDRLRREAAAAVRAGGLFALWVTDAAGESALRFEHEGGALILRGGKAFCSGAGHVTHAVVTAAEAGVDAPRLLMLDLDRGERVSPLPTSMSGMRAAVTGQVDFTKLRVDAGRIIGEPGDYMREPDFSAGAWRSSAVALGGLRALLGLLGNALVVRGRDSDPHQRVRYGETLMAYRTGQLWLEQAGQAAENLTAPPQHIVATVGLARTIVERACLDGIERVQRSLGLSAFLSGTPVERVARDLQTYLRQPAIDEVLVQAGGYFMTRPDGLSGKLS